MGPGDLVWEKFGHNAIWIHDAGNASDIVYHWGLFDFADADFTSNFMKGDMRYSMGAFDLAATVDSYRQANRTVWAQRLDLPPAALERLNQFLLWNNLPENRKYSYDYYRDNCSTRVRDAIDRAVGGAIRNTSEQNPSGTTFRFHTQRLTQDDGLVYAGTLAALGHPVDEPISDWDEMFLPVKLMEHLRQPRLPGPAGALQPIAADERVLFQATRAAEASGVTRGTGGFLVFAILSLLAGGGLLALSLKSGRSPVPFLLLATLWSLIAGTLGVVLSGLWAGTNHVYSYGNENVLQATPLSLVLAVMLVHLMWRHMRGKRDVVGPATIGNSAWLAIIIAALSVIGFLMQALPAFDQVNGGVIAIAMPLHLGVAAAIVALSSPNSPLRRTA